MKKMYTIVPIVVSLSVVYIATFVSWRKGWSLPWLELAAISLGIALLCIFIFTYRMWSLIQDGHARMTPVQAVAYSCIPGFNFWWLYVCICGFAYDCNAYIQRHHIQTQPVSVRVPFYYVTAWLLAIVPYVGIVSVPIAIVCVTIMLNQYVQALNDILKQSRA